MEKAFPISAAFQWAESFPDGFQRRLLAGRMEKRKPAAQAGLPSLTLSSRCASFFRLSFSLPRWLLALPLPPMGRRSRLRLLRLLRRLWRRLSCFAPLVRRLPLLAALLPLVTLHKSAASELPFPFPSFRFLPDGFHEHPKPASHFGSDQAGRRFCWFPLVREKHFALLFFSHQLPRLLSARRRFVCLF